MFKKKIIPKRQNILDEFENANNIDSHVNNNDQNDANEGVVEPKIAKKTKLNNELSYSTKQTTDDYNKATGEYLDEIMFKAKPELVSWNRENAVAQNEIDTEVGLDAKTIALRNMKLSKDMKEGKLNNKFYHGKGVTSALIEKSEHEISQSKFTGSLGPIRATPNIRVTCRFDYNPSLCKDWHDAGYCGFGDSCIYLHDRGDYKSGWEMDRDWEEEQKNKAKKFQVSVSKLIMSDDDAQENEESDGLPNDCQLCNNGFKSPVVTQCKHYFCEKCAFKHYKENKKCPVCNKNLNGIFNQAIEIIDKIKKKNNPDTKTNVVNANIPSRNKNGKNSNIREIQEIPPDDGEGFSSDSDKLNGVEISEANDVAV